MITGGAGFLGVHVQSELAKRGVRKDQLVIPRSKSDDLRDFSAAERR